MSLRLQGLDVIDLDTTEWLTQVRATYCAFVRKILQSGVLYELKWIWRVKKSTRCYFWTCTAFSRLNPRMMWWRHVWANPDQWSSCLVQGIALLTPVIWQLLPFRWQHGDRHNAILKPLLNWQGCYDRTLKWRQCRSIHNMYMCMYMYMYMCM